MSNSLQPMDCRLPGLPVHHKLLELVDIFKLCLSSWWWHPTISSSVVPFSSCLQSFPESGLFKWVSSSHKVAQSIGVSSGLISFRMEWLDLLAVQGTLKSLLQHHSLKASILLHSTFFIVQLSHPYMWRVWEGKKKDTERWSAHVGRCPICYWRSGENNSRKNDEMEPKQKQHTVVDVTGDERKVWCCKEQYFIAL